jgi:exodeoxyribonuclease V
MMLTKEQRHVVHNLLKRLGRDQVQTVGGLAGTGKTLIVAALSAARPGFAVCAYTGKAASVLVGKGTSATTIHGKIYKAVQRADGVEFRLKRRNEIRCDGFIVDEASMVSRELYSDLLSFGLPVTFVGDHGQLPPFGDDVYLMQDPTYRLETIHRNAGEIAHFAQHLRAGKKARSFVSGGKVKVMRAKDVTDDVLLHSGQIITPFNKDRVTINKLVRELRGRYRLLEKGERIICLRNHRSAGLYNGMQGKVTRVRPDRYLDFLADNGIEYREVCFDPRTFGSERPDITIYSDFHPFDYAYAITAHKAQGSEWKKVLVFEKYCRLWDMKRWNYTAASRAKKRLTWVTAT